MHPLATHFRLAIAALICTLALSASAQQPQSQTQPQPPPPAGTAPSQPAPTHEPAIIPIDPTDAVTPPPQDGATQGSPTQDSATQDQSPPPIAQDPGANDDATFVFKKKIEEVVLHATVVDDARRLVPSLDRPAFTIYENGVPETITSFRREDIPVALGVVVDNSGSMRDKRDKVNQAVVNLIRVSNPDDQIFVVNFSQTFYLDQDFTSDVNLLQTALHQVSTKGSTALYDALVASSIHLKGNQHLDKKVLLVITDGQDNMSQQTLAEASRRLQQNNGPVIYAIGLSGVGMTTAARDALQNLAAGTGGVAYFPQSLDEVDSITRTIAHDIRSQYTLAYKPAPQPKAGNAYRNIRVDARTPGHRPLTVRTRNGYYPGEAIH